MSDNMNKTAKGSSGVGRGSRVNARVGPVSDKRNSGLVQPTQAAAAASATANRPDKDLFVAWWPLDRLVPYARNARTHSDAQVAEIAGSIRAFGFTNPLLVGADGDIIAGHGRLAAARKLGMTEVPVIVLDTLSETERRQLVLADNRIALNAGWDMEMLKLEMRDLADLGTDLSTLGFDEDELQVAFAPDATDGLVDEDDVPDPQSDAISRTGDVWRLGAHRLICGDCTDRETVDRLLGDVVPGLMVTDPPYGVEYDPTWRHQRGVSSSGRTGKVANDERADWGEAWALFPGNIAYVWHAALNSPAFASSLIRHGFDIRAQIIWAKERLVIGRGDYHWQHEPCWYSVRKTGHWTGDRKQTTLWTIPNKDQDADTIHGTQKPVECMRRPMLNNSSPGQAVYEPFMGSGTTLIAAESTGRVCFGIEINPVYVDVAVRRWQTFTGKVATLDGDGRAFAEVAEERLGELKQTDPDGAVDQTDSNEAKPTLPDPSRDQPAKEGW